MKNSQLIFWFLISLLFGTIIALGLSALILSTNSGDGSVYCAQALSQICMFLLPAIVVAVLSRDAKSFLGLNASKGIWLKSFLAVLSLLLCIPFLSWLTQWNDGWHFPHFQQLESMLRANGEHSAQMVEHLIYKTGWDRLIVNLFVMALTPAICEELFFRCGIQQLLIRRTRKPWLSVIVTAIIFSLVHGEFFAFMPRFVMGGILGALFYKTGSVLVNVSFHFANNAIIVILANMAANGWCDASFVRDEYQYSIFLVILSLAFCSAFVFYLCTRRVTYYHTEDR